MDSSLRMPNFAVRSKARGWLGSALASRLYKTWETKSDPRKLQSKLVSALFRGYDGVIESLEHALQVSNDIGYPVLVKAAAGGGGKGMRTCYDDQEVREAFVMAKSEAKKFFADDRLLIEKYIENPHHIEFQVLCSPPPGGKLEKPEDLQVVVFPERECSIQRRNQKIIEESPSCLLTQETRLKMVEQVKMLCQRVGYVSAGTVEWLVDEKQNFYFLEMNTRLQVEHPVTEAVTGVDLVKGMLWVGAGRGFPPELQITGDLMPHKGHAVEARIYAEDPLRGYLPSTGPLVQYKEPETGTPADESYLRMDSGVIEGHVVSPYYDPMLSKIIAYAPTRLEAINKLADGLDQYVIEGVQHNARLCNAVLRHPSFQAGDTPTSFLPRHIPEFKGVQLSDKQEEELAVAVALIGLTRESYLQRPPIVPAFSSVVVRLRGMFGDAFEVSLGNEKTAKVKKVSGEKAGVEREVKIDSLKYDPERYQARVSIDGDARTIQVCISCYTQSSKIKSLLTSFALVAHFFRQVLRESLEGDLRVQMYGADMICLVQSPREYELSKYMHEPKIVDTSDFVMSPMPGTLISFAVAEGDHVEIGQELCIVEAMKMQNIVRAPRAGVIGKLNVAVGSSMQADDIIIEYGEEAKADEAA